MTVHFLPLIILFRDTSLTSGLTLRIKYSHYYLIKKTIEVGGADLIGAYEQGGEEKQGLTFLVTHEAF